MGKELKRVVWDKYMGSDIDSVTLFFDESAGDSVVGEFEVPEQEKHLVFYSEKKDNGSLVWIEIVNPQDVADREDATLPDIVVKAEGKEHSLQKVIKEIVKQ